MLITSLLPFISFLISFHATIQVEQAIQAVAVQCLKFVTSVLHFKYNDVPVEKSQFSKPCFIEQSYGELIISLSLTSFLVALSELC